jgi:hypothetical protein
MIKKLFISLMILAFGLTAARAADAATDVSNGKVAAISGNNVKIEIVGDAAAWIKKGAYVRALNEKGTLVLRGAKILAVDGNVITVQSALAKDLKVGDSYKMSKGKPSAGC